MDAYDKEVMKRLWTRRARSAAEFVGGLCLWVILAATMYVGCIVFD